LKFSFNNNFQIPNQNYGKVINYQDLENHPQKEITFIGGKLVKLVEKTGFSTSVPYVENGKVTLKNGDHSTETCTYENGKLVSYRRDVHRDPISYSGDLVPPHSSKGDHQYIEIYLNGQIKSADIKILEYGEHDGIQMKCQYDENGNYISGTKMEYDPYSDKVDWVEMNAEDACHNLDLYLLHL
jgi:hypothetical protein